MWNSVINLDAVLAAGCWQQPSKQVSEQALRFFSAHILHAPLLCSGCISICCHFLLSCTIMHYLFASERLGCRASSFAFNYSAHFSNFTRAVPLSSSCSQVSWHRVTHTHTHYHYHRAWAPTLCSLYISLCMIFLLSLFLLLAFSLGKFCCWHRFVIFIAIWWLCEGNNFC